MHPRGAGVDARELEVRFLTGVTDGDRQLDPVFEAPPQAFRAADAGRDVVFGIDFPDALREFEKLVRAHLKRESALAQTLGLEAAE